MTLTEYIKQNYHPKFEASDFPFEVNQKKAAKGTIILPYSKITNKMHFLNQGIVEVTVSFGEIEKTILFNFANTFFGSYASALTREPSSIQCVAIVDCVFEEFDFHAYQRACETSLLINKIGRVELEKHFLRSIQREKDFLTKTKKEMYLDLIQKNPEMLQKISLKKIANYFGILPETLSRIRKDIIS
ncbi:Crp/Fnr family transcriptional regulator [Aureispira anguillae]|uniref:Crp/Fnr family transcriptional regulator n=1 Tax=Aureispira anguillae TaxID=2864201 RepID=A0A915YCF2_9BACT|nr:Crp/Fnr family transcriptional regulator [Aureispira anguillae]BDS10515.1 Crp/Fnr family transcriptional regulator [Aureispira anguillae]